MSFTCTLATGRKHAKLMNHIFCRLSHASGAYRDHFFLCVTMSIWNTELNCRRSANTRDWHLIDRLWANSQQVHENRFSILNPLIEAASCPVYRTSVLFEAGAKGWLVVGKRPLRPDRVGRLNSRVSSSAHNT
jgi:hypothetical protein